MLKIEVLRGLPASGKSTYAIDKVAKDGNWVRWSNDDFRNSALAGKWSGKKERFVNNARDAFIAAALHDNKHVIVDATHLNDKHITRITEKFGGKADITVHYFPIEPEDAVARDAQRPVGKRVGSKVIWDMWDRYLRPEPPAYDANKPSCIIVDLDGTLCGANGRSPYAWDKVGGDTVHPAVARVVRSFSADIDIILMSGRDGSCQEPTEEWLAHNDVPYDRLIMRAAGDTRKDSVVKLEMYESYVRPHYNVELVIDDRESVCVVWKKLGLPLFQVFNPGEPTDKSF